MRVEYVENYIIVDYEDTIIYSDADARAGKSNPIITEEVKNYILENFKTFYLCSQPKSPIFPNLPVPDTVSKLRCLAPNRAVAEKAAERANAEARGYFYIWVEPV